MNLTPDFQPSISSAKCCDVPVPADADDKPPCFFFDASNTSFKVLYGLSAATTNTRGLVPIKVMGVNVDGFAEAITALAQRFDPGFDPTTAELRSSSAGKYLGVTVTITATSREQLDDLYRAFTGHPLVKMVL